MHATPHFDLAYAHHTISWYAALTSDCIFCALDCGAVGGINYKNHKPDPWNSPMDQIGKSFAAGLDTACNAAVFNASMLSAMKNSTSIAGAVDTALTHLFRVQFRLGMFDEPEVQPAWAQYGSEQINSTRNREIVLEAAAQGLVLLVNKPSKQGHADGAGDGSGARAGAGAGAGVGSAASASAGAGALPLNSATVKTLALVGPQRRKHRDA
jgi:beta-glucosidase-like glycosyl hydrolase